MPSIVNPAGAFQGVTDFTTYSDGSSTTIGRLLDYPRVTQVYRAGGAINRYDWVALSAATTTAPLSVVQLPVTDTLATSLACVGVALESADASGDFITVCTFGPTLCNIGTASPVASTGLATRAGSSAGACGVTATANHDASLIAGVVFGHFLTAEIGSLNLAAVFVRRF